MLADPIRVSWLKGGAPLAASLAAAVTVQAAVLSVAGFASSALAGISVMTCGQQSDDAGTGVLCIE